ncbi:TonB-dependent receptor [Massilia sp. B-10]|nr:TonB-dependent receptor [Massilia sp. B-10]
MEHGGTAPMQTTNENVTLEPSRSKQIELGVKGIVNNSVQVSGALFQIKKGFEYTDVTNTYVRRHEQTHRGLELSAQGNATRDLKYSLSLLALHMQQSGTGQADVDNKRTTNVPAFKSTAVLEYAVPSVAGLKVNGTWHYSGKKAFDAQNTLFVPGYHVFDLGSAYGMTVAKLQDHAARQRRQRDRQVLLA